MNPKDFKAPGAGKCVRTVDRAWAFVPGVLPGPSDVNTIWRPLSEADAALGAVKGLSAAAQLPFMHMLIAAAVRREAALSSQIEGMRTQLPDLFRAEIEDPGGKGGDDDLRETRNYVRALYHGVDVLRASKPIATRLVRQLHATLMEGVRGQSKTPGEFRKIQNYIGRDGDTVETAKYVPPPVEEMHRLLAEWEKYINTGGEIPDLVQCAVMHHRFEAIHPFLDGNGRVGRLLIPLFLIDRKRLSEPLLYLSDYLEANRRDYYGLIQRVHTDGDWTAWIRFFLEGVTYASNQALRQANLIANIRRELREKLTKKFRARSLLDELFSNPYVDNARAAKVLHVNRKTAQRSIDLLVENGILREVTGRSWGRMWVADSILSIINDPDRNDGETPITRDQKHAKQPIRTRAAAQ